MIYTDWFTSSLQSHPHISNVRHGECTCWMNMLIEYLNRLLLIRAGDHCCSCPDNILLCIASTYTPTRLLNTRMENAKEHIYILHPKICFSQEWGVAVSVAWCEERGLGKKYAHAKTAPLRRMLPILCFEYKIAASVVFKLTSCQPELKRNFF